MIERQKVAMEASPHLHVGLAPLTRVLKRSTLPKASLLNLPKSGFVLYMNQKVTRGKKWTNVIANVKYFPAASIKV